MALHPRGTVRHALIGVAAATLILLVVLTFTPVPPASHLTTFTVAGTLMRVHSPCCGDYVFEIEGDERIYYVNSDRVLPVKALGSLSKGDA